MSIQELQELISRKIDTLPDTGLYLVLPDLIAQGCDKFPDFGAKLPAVIYNKLINLATSISISSDVWKLITKKQDYLSRITELRQFPYTNINSEVWQEIAKSNFAKNYEIKMDEKMFKELFKSTEKKVETIDDQEHIIKKTYSTNYDSWDLLDFNMYDSIEKPLALIKILIRLGLEKPAIYTICTCLCSPYLCHIIKNPDVADYIKIQFTAENKENIKVLSYGMTYAFYILRQEEYRSYDKISTMHRFVFTLDEANKLPPIRLANCELFNSSIHIESHPYLPILKNKALSVIHDIPLLLMGERRILTKQEFQHRFDLVTNGLFAGINLKAKNVCVTGSILAPCVATNPLEELFRGQFTKDNPEWLSRFSWFNDKDLNTQDKEFMAFVHYYYPGYNDLKDADRSAAIAEQNDEKVVKSGFNTLSDIDMAVRTNDRTVFDSVVMQLFMEFKLNAKKKKLGTLFIRKILTPSSYRYCIYGEATLRPIEIFMSDRSLIRLVSAFHFPHVRMYYDDQVYITRTCLTSLLTGVGEEYKWFSSAKIPADTLLKCVQRGYSVYLSPHEVQTLTKFIPSSERWKIDGELFGFTTVNNRFFIPSLDENGVRKGLMNPKVYLKRLDSIRGYKTSGFSKKTKKNNRMKNPSKAILSTFLLSS